MQQFVSKHSSE